MKEVLLVPKGQSKIPVEAEVISPDVFTGKQLSEIEVLPVYVGNQTHALKDYFIVKGETAEKAVEQLITVRGDISHVKYVGSSMTAGRISVEGDIGMHAGSQMSGGEISVKGSASDWAGAEMRGGLLRIKGNAGDLLGAAYRGSKDGMTGGCIVVEGYAGCEAGSFMRRGMIVTMGSIGPFAGVHMNGGQIFVFGKTSKRLGAQMKGNGGVIVCLGGVEELLPTFYQDTTYNPGFMRIYMKTLRDDLGLKEADKFIDATFKRYRGDTSVGGDGDILILEG